MAVYKLPGLPDILLVDDFAAEIFEQIILQPEEQRLLKHAASGLQIAVNKLGAWRILLPVRELITIGLQNQVASDCLQHL